MRPGSGLEGPGQEDDASGARCALARKTAGLPTDSALPRGALLTRHLGDRRDSETTGYPIEYPESR